MDKPYIKNGCVYLESSEYNTIHVCVPIKRISSMGIFAVLNTTDSQRELILHIDTKNEYRNIEHILFGNKKDAKKFMNEITDYISGGK